MRKFLFVCTANICRSPMADTIFNALAKDGGLHFHAESAGVSALEGRPMAEKSGTVLMELGFAPGSPGSHRQVSREMVDEADLTLAMTSQHISYLCEMHKDPAKVWLLTEYATGGPCQEEITDPYGAPPQPTWLPCDN